MCVLCVCAPAWVCVHVCICMQVCMCTCMYMGVYMCVCVCVFMCMFMWVCMCVGQRPMLDIFLLSSTHWSCPFQSDWPVSKSSEPSGLHIPYTSVTGHALLHPTLFRVLELNWGPHGCSASTLTNWVLSLALPAHSEGLYSPWGEKWSLRGNTSYPTRLYCTVLVLFSREKYNRT